MRGISGYWHRHPGVRSGDELTRGERAADSMRNGMGSWAFVIWALVFLGVWMTVNGSHAPIPRPQAFWVAPPRLPSDCPFTVTCAHSRKESTNATRPMIASASLVRSSFERSITPNPLHHSEDIAFPTCRRTFYVT